MVIAHRKRCVAFCIASVWSLGGAWGGTNGTWSRTSSGGDWNTSLNWLNGQVASGQDAVADFSTLNITSDVTAHLDFSFTVGSLKFGDTTPSNNWILDATRANNVLTLSTSTGTPSIDVVNQQATISAALGGTQGFALSGAGTLVLSGANTLSGTITTTSASTLNAVWSGGGTFAPIPSGVTINNSGPVILTRNTSDARFLGTFSGIGPVTITGDGGYLNVGNPGDQVDRFSGSSDLTVNIGLNLFDNLQEIGALNGSGEITSNAGIGGTVGLEIGGIDNGTFSGVIDGNGSESIQVLINGSAMQTFTGANTYTGGTEIDSSSTLRLGDGVSSNGSVVGNIDNNGTLIFDNPNAQTFIDGIGDEGKLIKTGAGTLTLGSAQCGALTINGGTLVLNGFLQTLGAVSIGASGVSGQSGTLNIDSTTGFSQPATSSVTIGAASGSSGALNIGVSVSGSSCTSSSMTINPTGSVNVGQGSITGLLQVNGSLTINGGALSITSGSTFQVAQQLTVENGGTFTNNTTNGLTVFQTTSDTTYSITGQNSTFHSTVPVEINENSQLNVSSGGTVAIDGAASADVDTTISISGAGSSFSATSLTVNGEDSVSITNGGALNIGIGGLNFQGSTITLNGGSFADQGTITFPGVGSLAFTAGSFSVGENIEIASGGILVTNSSNSGSISTNTTLTSTRQLSTTGITTIDAGQTFALAGGSLTTANLIDNGTFTFTSGTLSITSGLTIGSAGPLGATFSLGSGRTLNVSAATGIQSNSKLEIGGGSFTSGTLSNSGTFQLDSGSASVTGTITNATGANINVTGGNLSAGAISCMGNLTLSGGNVQISSGLTLSASSGLGALVSVNGGTLIVGGLTQVNNQTSLSVGAAGDFISGNLGNNGSCVFNGAVNISGSVTNPSGATINITGGNYSEGNLTNAGNFSIGTPIFIAGSVSNQSGGIFSLGASENATVNSAITNNGEIQLGGGSATLTGNGTLTNSGLIDGGGDIGNPVTNGSNGEIRINPGDQIEFLSSVNNSGQLNLLGGTVNIKQTFTNSSAGSVVGRGELITKSISNSGTMTFSAGNVDIFGAVTNLSGAKITVTGGGLATFYNSFSLPTGATLQVSSGSTAAFEGAVTGSGTISGSGLIIFDGGMSSSIATLATVVGSAQIATGASLSLNSFDENSMDVEGKMQLAPGGTSSQTNALTIGPSSSLDLSNDALAVSYVGTSPASTIRSYLTTGYDAGKWDGDGIDSSAVVNNYTSLGYVDTGMQVLIQYTWTGDANLDGIVNDADLADISSTGTTWQSGDFNYDGKVNADDYSLFMLGLSESGGENISTTVPEPIVLGSLALPLFCIVRRRRNI